MFLQVKGMSLKMESDLEPQNKEEKLLQNENFKKFSCSKKM